MVKPRLFRRNKEKKIHVKDRLPSDIEQEILSRLPAKSITRFRSVCKAWNEAVESQPFREQYSAKRNDQLKPRDEYFVFKHDENDASFMVMLEYKALNMLKGWWDATFTEKFQPTRLQLSPSRIRLCFICSCNGLLCLASNFKATQLLLCNPITREVLKLMPLGELKPYYLISLYNWVVFGFGFNSITREYKVLAAPRCKYNYTPIELQIIRVCTIPLDGPPSPWKTIDSRPFELVYVLSDSNFIDKQSIQINNVLHWDAVARFSIVSFNLSDDKFQLMSTQTLEVKWYEWYQNEKVMFNSCLTEFNGDLAFITNGLSFSCPTLTIWAMEEYGNDESWTVKISFRHPRKLEWNRGLGNPRYFVWRDGKLIVCLAGAVICYDQKTKMSKQMFRLWTKKYMRHEFEEPLFLTFDANLSPLYGAVKMEECQELFN